MTEFGDFSQLVTHEQTVEGLQVLQAQLGLGEADVVELTNGLGIMVLRMLVEASAHEELEPILDIAIRRGSTESPIPLSTLPIIERNVQSISHLKQIISERRDSD